jgi:hypothetical protein
MSAIEGLIIGGVIGLVGSSAIMYFALHSSFYDPQTANRDPVKGPRRVRIAVVVIIVISTIFGALFGLTVWHSGSS